MIPPLVRPLMLALLAVALAGCPDEPPDRADEETPAPDATPPQAATPPEDPHEPERRLAAEPPALEVETVASGLAEPTDGTSPPDDPRLFITERAGTVRILADGELVEQPFLDLREQVTTEGLEQGLLSLAFHPDYPDDPRFFVHYSGAGGQTVLSEFRVSDDPDRADPDSEAVLLTVDQPARNHNGGRVAFGPDGMLYLALGDGGGAGDEFGHGQDPTTKLAALLRLDVSEPGRYAVPPDNPGMAGGGEMAPEVWAYGLRNPFRFAFDEDLLYIADVGQDEWEWVNVVPADEGGLNHGWPITEGSRCFDPPTDCPTEGLVMPVLEYANEGGDCAIIGGFAYRGEAIAGLDGHYLYSDLCGGWLRSFAYDPEAGEVRHETEHVETGRLAPVYSFARDHRGEIYVLSGDGTVHRVVAAP